LPRLDHQSDVVGVDELVLVTSHQQLGSPTEEVETGVGNKKEDALESGDRLYVRGTLPDETTKRPVNRLS
jgi:hypothetical protein